MAEMTGDDIARQYIFGDRPPQEPEVAVEEQPEEVVETPTDTTVETPVVETPVEPKVEIPEVPKEVDYSKIPDEKLMELINTKFNTKFDTAEAAMDYFNTQATYRGQEEIIKQLANKLKESSNVLSHFPDENSYKVAQLAKEKYPNKQGILSRVVGANLENMSDFEAIRLAEELKRPSGSKVDALTLKLARLGLRDNDISDFENWDELDKQLLIGEAEDAKAFLGDLGKDVTIPEAGVDDFVSQIESGFQDNEKKLQQLTELYQPVAESLVNNRVKINPVEGSDFEYEVNLDAEGKKDLIEFLTAEAIEGEYNIKSDDDIRRLDRMLISEIWATDGPKMMAAYKDHVTEKVWEEARQKYENAQPLDESVPPTPAGEKKVTDEDRARQLINRGY